MDKHKRFFDTRGASIVFALGFILVLALFGFGCNDQAFQASASKTGPSHAEIRAAVDKIEEIVGLSPKRTELEWDPNVIAILEIGKKAGPYLVEKITDTTLTQVVEGFQYTIGDLALVLLERIYQPPGWPFPDNSEIMSRRFDDFRDYMEFMKTEGIRLRLQRAWKHYVKSH